MVRMAARDTPREPQYVKKMGYTAADNTSS